jgi:DNA-binding response OmpR family regulator
MAETILIVEDDPSILRGLEMNLALEGYVLLTATDGEEALRLARQARPSLILLDIMLPKADGFAVIRGIRNSDQHTLILVLSARGEESDKLMGLSLGADDYVTKPFSLPELLARIRTALRRQRRQASPQTAEFGAAFVDFAARRLTVNQRPVDTTAREFELLKFFLMHDEVVVSRDQILSNVWDGRHAISVRTIDNFVSRLRQKIEIDPIAPVHLETVRGVGYRFCSRTKR